MAPRGHGECLADAVDEVGIALDHVVTDCVVARVWLVQAEVRAPACQLHQQVLDQASRRGVHVVQPVNVPFEQHLDLLARKRVKRFRLGYGRVP